MPPAESPPPSASGGLSSQIQIHEDHALNTPIAHVRTMATLDKTSISRWDSEKKKKLCFDSTTSLISDSHRSSTKSSGELVKEIAALEVEIVHLERHLLSLYQTAFQQNLPRISGNHAEEMNGKSHSVISNHPSPKIKIATSKENTDCLNQSSPTSSLSSPIDSIQEKQIDHPKHRSLADHFGNSCIDDARIFPDRLSEDILKCVSSIYFKLANTSALTYKGCSVSSTSSFCSSGTLSPMNFPSPLYADEVTENYGFKGLKQVNEPYAAMVEVMNIRFDDESYSYADNMLQKFRSLVKSLEIVDPRKMSREEKLAFWINIHNALVMHGYLVYGTQNSTKSTVLKASYNVGGHCINAYDIQTSILGIRQHYSERWLQTLISPGKKQKSGNIRHIYALEYPEPLVHFALCSGAYSDPAVRVYTAKNVFEDLNVAMEEFIRGVVCVQKETKIYLPRILGYYAKDMSFGMSDLLEMISGCLSGIRKNAVISCLKGRPEKNVRWLEQSSSFRYLIQGNS